MQNTATHVRTTLNLWNHFGSWCAYQASGVGIHYNKIKMTRALVSFWEISNKKVDLQLTTQTQGGGCNSLLKTWFSICLSFEMQELGLKFLL